MGSKKPWHDAPPCPRGCGTIASPTFATDFKRWYGPESATLWCPACAHAWRGTTDEMIQACKSWIAWEEEKKRETPQASILI